MVNLAAWDAKVAADNAANGTESVSNAPSLMQVITDDDRSAAEKAISEAGQKPAVEPVLAPEPATTAPQAPTGANMPPATGGRARDPDDDDSLVLPTGTLTTAPQTRGALLEDSVQAPRKPQPQLPGPPTQEGIAAAKKLLAEAEAEAARNPEGQTGFVPDPPAERRTARKNATKIATKTANPK